MSIRPMSLYYLDRARSALTQTDLHSDDRVSVARWWIDAAYEVQEQEVRACDLWAQIRATCTGESFRQRVLADYRLEPSDLWKANPSDLIAACNEWFAHLANTADIPF